MSKPSSALSLLQGYEGDEDDEVESTEVYHNLNLPAVHSAPSVASTSESLNITPSVSEVIEQVLVTDGTKNVSLYNEAVGGVIDDIGEEEHDIEKINDNVKAQEYVANASAAVEANLEEELQEDIEMNDVVNASNAESVSTIVQSKNENTTSDPRAVTSVVDSISVDSKITTSAVGNSQDLEMTGDNTSVGEAETMNNISDEKESPKLSEEMPVAKEMVNLRVVQLEKLIDKEQDFTMENVEAVKNTSDVMGCKSNSTCPTVDIIEKDVSDEITVVQDQGDYRDSDESSDSEDSSSDSSDSPIVISSEEDETGLGEEQAQTGKKKKLSPEEEYCPGFLPAIEDLTISVEENQCLVLGKVASIVDKMVVVQANKNTPALDEDSVLFLEMGKKTLGRIFDTFGCVSQPSYVVRFNSAKHVEERGIVVGAEVFCAPQTEHSHFILVSQLLKMKWSDASWKNDMEVPPELQDYSDDEQERAARRQRKSQKDNNRVEIIYEGERPPAKRGRGRGAARGHPSSSPYQSQVQGNPFAGGRGSYRPQRQEGYPTVYQQTRQPPPSYQPYAQTPPIQPPPTYQPQYYQQPPPRPQMGPQPTYHNYPPPPSPSFGGSPGWPNHPQQNSPFHPQRPPQPSFQQQYHPPSAGYETGGPPGYPPPYYGYQ